MEFKIKAIVEVTAEHSPGMVKSKHIETKVRLEVSKNLKQDEYIDDNELPTQAGSHALTNALVAGLIGNIHAAHQKGWKNDAEHLRYIIAMLEDGFMSYAITSEGTM